MVAPALTRATVSAISSSISFEASALRQRSHFGRHYVKTAALFSGAGRLDRGIQRQNVGLEGNPAYGGGELTDFSRSLRYAAHGIHHRANQIFAAPRGLRGLYRQLPGLVCVSRIVTDGGGNLFHAGRGLLQCGSLAAGLIGQVSVAAGNVASLAVQYNRFVADRLHRIEQAVLHLPDQRYQLPDTVAAKVFWLMSEVAILDGLQVRTDLRHRAHEVHD